MAPTLRGHDWQSGDLVLTERVSYWFRRPHRWEVVTFRTNDGVQVMKRVIGLPGEHVQMRRDGQILIDGRAVERPAELHVIRYLPQRQLDGREVGGLRRGLLRVGRLFGAIPTTAGSMPRCGPIN